MEKCWGAPEEQERLQGSEFIRATVLGTTIDKY